MKPAVRPMPARAAGFSLLEIMIALALGLLLSVGILSLFGTTSSTNKLQNGLARLQEAGRFAVTRMQGDLRSSGGQYCSNFSGNGTVGTSVPMIARSAPVVFAENLAFADGINSIDSSGVPTAAAATGSYILSPRYFIQGYTCDTPSDCAAGMPAFLPAQNLVAGGRLPASDVLTVRYQRGSGWPVPGANTCSTGGTLTFAPQAKDDPVNFDPALGAQLAVVSDCVNSSVVPVAAFAGTTLTLGNVLASGVGEPACTNPGERDMRVFNFSRDFVTVTYSVELREDESPDARPNSPAPRRLIPTLVRRENGGDAQELVRGVDQLKFLYGVQDGSGDTRYLTAAEVDAGVIPCPPRPEGAATAPGTAHEPGCLWRSVRTIEARLLVNTGDELMTLDPASLEYHYMGVDFTPTETSEMPSGLLSGRTLRREFIAFASNRNYNF